ncbi:glycoside hydrolase family 18 protein [Garciella nitratireducens]|uniref:Spore germination protein n=1 Tax=Garciella nitratireducens DSM 15102 TaxID=1121911 RepID=A0A1T4PJ61_9FIRM|nr:glycoside hydrolase family 18 protein [Garciella nitratireducens]SJZ90898.1 spore germination protein [Garciella nitratireducens DSM 15102]
MEIHVVQSGETIFTIAAAYGVDPQRILDINQIQHLPYLVPGQALIIPITESLYTVQQGDSLWSIAKEFNINLQELIDLNNIQNPHLIYPGMVLKIPIGDPVKFGTIQTNAYINPIGNEQDIQQIHSVEAYLTYLSPFSYQIKEDGTLTDPQDDLVLQAAKDHGIAPLMVLTNFKDGNFDTGLAHTVLSDEGMQDILIKNLLEVLERKNYYGLNIDFERVASEDRERYNEFLKKVVGKLKPKEYPVSTALAPKPYEIEQGEWHGAHDYQAHGEIVDFVVIMTYEYGWAGGQPMAVSPLNEVRSVLDYATSVIPSEKIMMGIPLYGYDWTLPYTPEGDWAAAISPQYALQLATKYGAVIEYDYVMQSPYFYYWDNGVQHEVWFEDARSIQAKLYLVDEYGLKGVSYWVLGYDFAQNWVVLKNMYNIQKIED